MKRTLLLYGITTLIAGAICLIIASIRGVFTVNDSNTVIHYLVDSAFTVGVIIFCLGLLVFVSNLGAFSMLRYGIYRFATLFRHDPAKIKFRTYYDYVQATKEKNTPYGFLLIVGGLYIVISLILLLFWHRPEA